MALPRIDRTGNRYGLWTVVGFAKKLHYGATWKCRCDCGNIKDVLYRSLDSGASTSCGCNAIQKRIPKLFKHGYASTPTYKSWHSMHQRVQGLGGHEMYVENKITVCEDWKSFNSFLMDMGERPSGTTLDRIDNTKGYFKANCRWTDQKTQINNRSNTVYVYVGDNIVPASVAAKIINIGISCLRHRIRAGSIKKATQKEYYSQLLSGKDRKGALDPSGIFIKE